jgi:hypothetical protein
LIYRNNNLVTAIAGMVDRRFLQNGIVARYLPRHKKKLGMFLGRK